MSLLGVLWCGMRSNRWILLPWLCKWEAWVARMRRLSRCLSSPEVVKVAKIDRASSPACSVPSTATEGAFTLCFRDSTCEGVMILCAFCTHQSGCSATRCRVAESLAFVALLGMKWRAEVFNRYSKVTERADVKEATSVFQGRHLHQVHGQERPAPGEATKLGDPLSANTIGVEFALHFVLQVVSMEVFDHQAVSPVVSPPS